MADTTNQTAPATKTVKGNMPVRTVLKDNASTEAFIRDCMTKYSDFGSLNVVSPYDPKRKVFGLTVTPDEVEPENFAKATFQFDAEIFPADWERTVEVLKNRGEGPDSSTIKGIVIGTQPTRAQIEADEAGNKWIDKIIATELSRRRLASLRDAKVAIDTKEALGEMPLTLADYVVSTKGGASTLTEGFETFWKSVKDALGKLSPAWLRYNLSKKEIKRAMRSVEYASRWYPTLESATDKKSGSVVSLFELAIKTLILKAAEANMDKSLLEDWLSNRATYQLDSTELEEEETDDDAEEPGLDMDSLAAMMAPKPAAEEAKVEGTESNEPDEEDKEAAAFAAEQAAEAEAAKSEAPATE